MKRCSQCEFVYEDEQGVCDMDGSELVYEPTLYPPPSNATTTSPLKFRSRSFILTAAATLIMGSVLAVGFYGVTNRSERPTSAVTPVASESAPPSVVVEPAATPAKETSEPASDAKDADDTNAKSRNAATTSAAAKPAAGSRTTTTRTSTKPASAPPKKEDSKVGGLIKKTGRILKKPFKF